MSQLIWAKYGPLTRDTEPFGRRSLQRCHLTLVSVGRVGMYTSGPKCWRGHVKLTDGEADPSHDFHTRPGHMCSQADKQRAEQLDVEVAPALKFLLTLLIKLIIQLLFLVIFKSLKP